MRTDNLVGGVLGLVAVAAVGAAFVVGTLSAVVLAGLVVAGVSPISYKLLFQPSVRAVPLGIFARKARRAKLGWVRRGGVFSFSGIDGSGKSSSARAVANAFEDLGLPTAVRWGRWRPIVSYPFMGLLYVLFGLRRKDYEQKETLQRIWSYLVLLDLVAFSLVYVYPTLLRGGVVCVDRYLYDTVVEMKYDNLYNERALPLFEALLPTPETTFLLDVSVDESLARKDDTGEMLQNLGRDIETRDYLEVRRHLYLDDQKAFDATVVDATQSQSAVETEVVSTALDDFFDF